MSTPPRRRSVRLRAVVVGLLVLVSGAGLAASAGAAGAPGPVLGGLHVDPPTGTADQSNLRLTTVSTGTPPGCPSTAPRYTITVTGPGTWANGVQFAGGSTTPGTEIDIPMTPTFASMAASKGAPLQAGRYDLQVTCTSRIGQPQGAFTTAIWFTDSQHYQSNDPATTTTVTSVSIADNPPGRSELGNAVTFSAMVTPDTAAGSIQFLETVNDSPLPYAASVRVVNGTAQLVVTNFTFGLHLMSAKFVPDDTKRFAPAVSPAPELAHVTAKPIPPLFAVAPTVQGAAGVVGSTLTCAASIDRATSVGYAWLLSGQLVNGATQATYTTRAADKGKPLVCRATAANAGGQISGDSAPVTVG